MSTKTNLQNARQILEGSSYEEGFILNDQNFVPDDDSLSRSDKYDDGTDSDFKFMKVR